MRFVPLLVALPLLLTGCSNGGGSPGPSSLPTVGENGSCPPAGATAIPSDCVTAQPPDGPPPIPFDKFPKTSAAIPAVTIDAAPGDLARGGNDADPTLTTRTFNVTVPAGARLQVVAACNGAAFLDITTVPKTKVDGTTISCFDPGGVSQLGIGDDVVQKSPASFAVTVTVKAPSRWYLAVGSTTEAPPPAEG